MIKKYSKQKFTFSFTPHLSPMFRGILSTIYVDLKKGKRNIAIIKIRIREKIKGESSWLSPIFPTG